tara:strand:- start:695 stop:1147 length:453 start_codon:yes stop_codon:yes gene_type:complete
MNNLSVQNRQRAFKISSELIEQAVESVMNELFQNKKHELSIVFIGENRMAEINQQYLDHKGPTDVLTFNYPDESPPKSEILICPSVAYQHAKSHNVSLGCELTRYIIHGILHVQGYSDLTSRERSVMKQKENRTLNKISKLMPLDNISHG